MTKWKKNILGGAVFSLMLTAGIFSLPNTCKAQAFTARALSPIEKTASAFSVERVKAVYGVDASKLQRFVFNLNGPEEGLKSPDEVTSIKPDELVAFSILNLKDELKDEVKAVVREEMKDELKAIKDEAANK